jgi:hypothetical protein
MQMSKKLKTVWKWYQTHQVPAVALATSQRLPQQRQENLARSQVSLVTSKSCRRKVHKNELVEGRMYFNASGGLTRREMRRHQIQAIGHLLTSQQV